MCLAIIRSRLMLQCGEMFAPLPRVFRSMRAGRSIEGSAGTVAPRTDRGRGLVRIMGGMPRALCFVLAALSGAGPVLAGQMLEGRVTHVRDVDTIVVNNTAVRLNGLDGPEMSTRVGREARDFMVSLVQGKSVVCQLNGARTYDRWVGVCFLNGEDIGAIAVGNGYALDCRRYSGGKYRHFETPNGRSRIGRAGYCR